MRCDNNLCSVFRGLALCHGLTTGVDEAGNLTPTAAQWRKAPSSHLGCYHRTARHAEHTKNWSKSIMLIIGVWTYYSFYQRYRGMCIARDPQNWSKCTARWETKKSRMMIWGGGGIWHVGGPSLSSGMPGIQRSCGPTHGKFDRKYLFRTSGIVSLWWKFQIFTHGANFEIFVDQRTCVSNLGS